jgi:hypothetical protein
MKDFNHKPERRKKMANGTKVSLAADNSKIEKIKKTVTRKLYGKQRPNLDLRDDVSPRIDMLGEACFRFVNCFFAIFVGICAFFSGGVEAAMAKGLSYSMLGIPKPKKLALPKKGVKK